MGFASLGEASARMAAQCVALAGVEAGEGLVTRLRAALALGQDTRLLQIETALPTASLVVERCTLTEAVHAEHPLWAEVDCLSSHALLALKALNGEQMTLRLLQGDGAWRTWHGYVVRAAQLGADGGLARYRLTLAAWTHWLTLRRDTRIFQDQTTQDIVSSVMAAYPQANFKFDVASPGTMRAITTQYRETDWAFVQRLMADAGWTWRLVHDGETEGAVASARAAKHCLVISDAQASPTDLGHFHFSRPDMRDERGAHDTVTAWRVGQRVSSNAVTLASWDERQLVGVSAQAQSAGVSKVPPLEFYQGHGERRFVDGRVQDAISASSAQAMSAAEAVLAAYQLQSTWVQGDSAVRVLHDGVTFGLLGHSLYDAAAVAAGKNRFTVLSVVHEMANNLGTDLAHALQTTDVEQGSYRNRFTAAPADMRVLPRHTYKPIAPGLQTAIVVTEPSEPVTSDRDGRIRIQFAWQRGEQPLRGALSAPCTADGQPSPSHAPGDARSGTWVRVAQSVAGPNWGAVFTPRAGTEVLVDFMDGDIDRPVVIGQLHNGQHDLPWPAGMDSDANHAGALSGWHSPNLDGCGANQWVIDDSQGQLRMRLASHSAATGWSELSVGRLVQHSGQGGAGHATRGQALGEGFYGSTDGWAVVRAGQGLFLSTTARPALGSSVHSTQMDAAEAVVQLKAARQLGDALSQSAQQQGAQGLSSHDAGAALAQHTANMDPAAQGRYDGAVGGQAAQKAVGRNLTDSVERFAKPLLHLDTPVSASFVTPASISMFSGQDTSLVTQADLHMTAKHAFSAVSGQTTSLYTHAGGIKAVTANADLSVRAHTDAQQIWSEQDLTVQSTTDAIYIQASNSIKLTAGQSQIVLEGGNVTFMCPGTWTVKAVSHDWGGGESQPATLQVLPFGTLMPQGQFSVQYVVNGANHQPIANYPYEIRAQSNGVVVLRGVTDEEGRTERYYTDQKQEVFELYASVDFGQGTDTWPSERVHRDL